MEVMLMMLSSNKQYMSRQCLTSRIDEKELFTSAGKKRRLATNSVTKFVPIGSASSQCKQKVLEPNDRRLFISQTNSLLYLLLITCLCSCNDRRSFKVFGFTPNNININTYNSHGRCFISSRQHRLTQSTIQRIRMKTKTPMKRISFFDLFLQNLSSRSVGGEDEVTIIHELTDDEILIDDTGIDIEKSNTSNYIIGDQRLDTTTPKTSHNVRFLQDANENIKDLKQRNSVMKTKNKYNMTALAEEYDFWNDHLTVRSFNMDLNNLAQDDPAKAQDAIDIMQELYDNNPESAWVVQPDCTCYTTVMDGWIEVGQLDKAQEVLNRMEELDDKNKMENRLIQNVSSTAENATRPIVVPNNSIAPTEYTYMLMAQGWASDSKDDFAGKSASKAEQILRRMQQRNMSVSVKVWSIVLEGWCKRAGICSRVAIRRAEKILDEMESLDAATSITDQTDLVAIQQTTNNDGIERRDFSDVVRPNVLTYTSYIGGLSRCQENDLGHRAEKIVDRMKARNVQPDMVTYTAVLNCWAKSISRREREVAASRALYILETMERSYVKKGIFLLKPSIITYAAAIAAIGNSLDPQAPELAEQVLHRMYRLHESGTIPGIKPTTSTYNAVIYAFSRAPKGNTRVQYAKRAEDMLTVMSERARNGESDVQPDVRTWASVLRAWSRCGSSVAAENAQRVLDRLETMYQNGETNVRPNFVCYTTVMGAWGYSSRRDAIDKLELILKKMEDGYEETLEAEFRPNTVSYVTAIDALVRRNERDAAQRSQAIVDRMLLLYSKGLGHVRPTRTVLNCLIHAWSKSKDMNAAQNAEKIFKWMEMQYQGGDDLVRPDFVSLCAVLNAWANQAEHGGAERAVQIWEHTKHVSLEDRGVKPTITVPNIVIKAIARSNDPDAHKKAEEILLRLEEEYRDGISQLRPDVTTYSSVINACAYCVGNVVQRGDALETAMRTFQKLCSLEDEKPNNISYGTVFKAIQNLMPVSAHREDVTRTLFDKCCEDGLVDSFVLSQVRYACPQLYRDLVEEPCGLAGPDSDTSIDAVLRNIPSDWSENVIE